MSYLPTPPPSCTALHEHEHDPYPAVPVLPDLALGLLELRAPAGRLCSALPLSPASRHAHVLCVRMKLLGSLRLRARASEQLASGIYLLFITITDNC